MLEKKYYDGMQIHDVICECLDDYDTILTILEKFASLPSAINADHKTENSSEKPNNCEDLQDWKDRMWAEAIVTEPTISKMEQVDEPQTCSVNGRPYSECSSCEHFRCTADEPQTEDEMLREQCRAFIDIVEQTERSNNDV